MIMTVLWSCTAGTRGGKGQSYGPAILCFFSIKSGSSMLPYLFGYTSLRQIHKIYLFFILLYCSFAIFALWRLVLYVLQYDSMYLLDESSSLVFFILFLIIQQILGQFNLRHINQIGNNNENRFAKKTTKTKQGI